MSTALQLDKTQWLSYAGLAGRQTSKHADHAAVAEALERVRKVSQLIKQALGARRVILFGSLANASDFNRDSDIDLAVEGLTGRQYWEAWRMAEEAFPDRSVEVVELETASSSLRGAIEKHGIAL